jgi:hypothetical protein
MIKGDGNIIWLASYPKSGNTWFRAFYTNLTSGKDRPAGINELEPKLMASSRQLFDQYSGIESSDLKPSEIDCLRPRVYETLSMGQTESVLIKVHDAFTLTVKNEPMISLKATGRVLYFLRNPLDVAVSFAHHNACSIDHIIERMGDERYCLCCKKGKIVNQLRQMLSSWSGHVTGWMEGLGSLVHIVRYEDMVMDTIPTFTAAVRFAGFPDDPIRIEKALDYCRIDELQKQEKAVGFKEKTRKSESFFRKGAVGSWREALTDTQVLRIIRDHREVMKRFGYLNDNDEPVF